MSKELICKYCGQAIQCNGMINDENDSYHYGCHIEYLEEELNQRQDDWISPCDQPKAIKCGLSDWVLVKGIDRYGDKGMAVVFYNHNKEQWSTNFQEVTGWKPLPKE